MGLVDKLKSIVAPLDTNHGYDNEDYVFEDSEQQGYAGDNVAPTQDDGFGYDDSFTRTQTQTQAQAQTGYQTGYQQTAYQEPIHEQPRVQQQRRTAPEAGGISSMSGNFEIMTIYPKNVGDVSQIADALLQNRTVIINFEHTEKDVRRIRDFIDGVVYAIGGNHDDAGTDVYIVSPSTVTLTQEKAARKAASRQDEDEDE